MGRFVDAILAPKRGDIAIIAEIKFASPTEPRLGTKSDLVKRAKQYKQAGADAISLIVEPHVFKGDLSDVAKVKKAVSLPILVKDFVVDEGQIYQIKQAGADAVLLIAQLVDKATLSKFVDIAGQLGVEPLIEVNDEEDLRKAVETKTKIMAINARNLDTLEVDVEGACRLLSKVPNSFVKLGFSGINGKAEVDKYKKAGAKGVLVGTSLMKAKNIGYFLGGLRGQS